MFLLVLALVAAQDMRSDKVHEPDRIGDVTSTGMSGGVNAGMIGSVQQNYTLPTLVSGPLLNEFKSRFTDGARLYTRLQDPSQTDQQYKKLFSDTDTWFNETYLWLIRTVSPWAAERFLFRTGSAMSWSLPGEHDPEVAQNRSHYINAVYPVLQNLDQLMREPSIYPVPPAR